MISSTTWKRMRHWVFCGGFSAGYFNAVRREDGSLQLNDLRFGTFSGRAEDPDDYIFRFNLMDRGPSLPYGFERAQGGPPDEKAQDMMMDLFDRAMGLSPKDLFIAKATIVRIHPQT